MSTYCSTSDAHTNSHPQEPHCPLCPLADPTAQPSNPQHACKHYHSDNQRSYWHCPVCDLVFVPPRYHLDFSKQKTVYDTHQNSPDDEGYRHFLSRLTQHLIPRLPKQAKGLDYGCGPGPALPHLLIEAGFSMATYDPIYAPFPPQSSTPTPASDTLRHLTGYDFVTATEVVEHFCNTAEEMTQLWQCLKPGGWLGIMTKRVTAPSAFGQWHYIRDPTHVSFFSDTTFRWLAVQWQAQLELPEKDVALLQKPC